MCGITGFWRFQKDMNAQTMEALAQKMAATIEYRGPDDVGVWCDEQQGLALAHRRLSILDLSPLGHQPMVSASGNSVIIYNGEVYSTDVMRQELEAMGKVFRSHTDTEVILEACETWGVEHTVNRCVGMFAFAYWNKASKKLFLVRDRLGIKPLYWGRCGDTLFFGSQLRSFLPHPDFKPDIDSDALSTYFSYNYIPAPYSIYKGISKLHPGHMAEISCTGQVKQYAYWSMEKVVSHALANPYGGSDAEQIEELDDLLKEAVRLRMIADVPLGAFLSGGIDSSLVVALMQAQSTNPVKTFSIGFQENDFDESRYARNVATHLGTDHHELLLDAKQAQSIIPQLPQWYDEPFADVSQIPTYLVSRLAKDHVTVALSGDGGDELFAGYGRYFMGDSLWRKTQRLPSFSRSLLSKGLTTLSPSTWDSIGRMIPGHYFSKQLGDKIHKGAALLKADNEKEFYENLIRLWPHHHGLVPQGRDYSLSEESLFGLSFTQRMQYWDTRYYLPDDILTKVDRASMAVSLEARVPLLDHRVVAFAWRLPAASHVRQGQGKWILRQVLKRYIPETFFERPKMGFGVPIDKWMREDLKDWCEDLLSVSSLKSSGLLNPDPIRQRWEQHKNGSRNWQYSLWSVLMFQMWYSRTL